MRIAFFTDTFYPQINGVSNTLSYLSRYLTEHGIEHIFYAPDYGFETPECERLPVLRFKGYAPIIYPDCRLSFVSFDKMAGILSDFAPDVVHVVSEFGIGLAGLRAASALGIPVVMSYHTNFDQYLQFYHLTHLNHLLLGYMKWFHSFALINLCPSGDTLQTMRQQGFKNLGIWSRGIDAKRFSPAYHSEALRKALGCEDKTVFLYVGRVSCEKGLDVLLQSMQSTYERHGEKVCFWITGNGPYLEEMRAQRLPNVMFTGEKRGEALSAIYASADAFVFPSGTETFGNVVLEAMASGLPVICTDSGGVVDYTVHEENALVCRYNDAHSLSGAIERMLDPNLRAHIRVGALNTAHARSWESIFDALMEHYALAHDTDVSGMKPPVCTPLDLLHENRYADYAQLRRMKHS